MALHHGERTRASTFVKPVAPHAPGCGLLDAEKKPVHRAKPMGAWSRLFPDIVDAVMRGLVPRIHVFPTVIKAWMAATPGRFTPVFDGLCAAKQNLAVQAQSRWNFPIWRCWAVMRRTVPVTERITTVSVSINFSRKRTPRNIRPSVTPVAANRQSPRTMSSIS
jgi:hypothetical protein